MASPTNDQSSRFGTRDIGTYDVLDLFAGPGGLDVAAHFLGLSTIGVEWDANACETRYAAGLPTIHADVREAREDADLCRKLVENTRILTGGPPCQTFSVAGSGAGRKALTTVTTLMHQLLTSEKSVDDTLASLDDPRTALVLEPLRWILEAIKYGSPFEAIALEQVPAVLPVWHVYEQILRELLPGDVRYRAYASVLCTEEFGVPQTRRRAVLVAQLLKPGEAQGTREQDKEILLPSRTHHRFLRPKSVSEVVEGDAALFPAAEVSAEVQPAEDPKEPTDPPRLPWASMQKALGDARDAVGHGPALVSRTTPFVVVSNYGSGGDPANRGRRPSSMPAFTVTGKVSRNRLESLTGSELPRFTIHEAGVLQTFPADFPWSGRDQAQQVGNAVPPRFAAHVLASAASVLEDFDQDRLRTALKELNSWHWEAASAEERDALRLLGCGVDRAACPPSPPHLPPK